MLLWVILAVLTAATVAVVLRPLRLARDTSDATQAGGIAVYKDQLAEIEADRERGLLTEAEAGAARLEVQRRLLRQADHSAQGRAIASAPAARTAMLVAMIGVPLLAVLGYALLGSPHLPNQPLSARRAAAPERVQVEMLVARVEEQLRLRPDDGRGWEVLAPVYARLGRASEALEAWRQAIRLQGESPARLRGLVEAALAVTNGIVDAEARGALEKLRVLDEADPIPRFWLAIGKQQNGDRAGAAADYQALLDGAPPDAPWRAVLEERLAEVRIQPAPGGDARTAVPGPTAEQVAAAQQMSGEDRARMIAGMVEGLAARLDKDGSDSEGWLRLIQAYNVLGRKDDARAAVTKAQQALARDQPALARVTALAKELGL